MIPDPIKEIFDEFDQPMNFEESPKQLRPIFECPKCGVNGQWLRSRECYYCKDCFLIFAQGYTEEREYKQQPLKFYSPDEQCLQ